MDEKSVGKELLSRFSDEQKRMAAFSINHFGTGEHPCPDEKELAYFTEYYLVTCLRQVVMSSFVTEEGKDIASALISKIENKPMSIAEYINDYDGIVCPICRAQTNMYSEDFDTEGSSVYQEVHCKVCGMSWIDKYDLVGFIMIDN